MNKEILTFLIFESLLTVMAVLRFFMKGWLQPLGVSDPVGSLASSILVVLLVGLIVIFIRQGRAPRGSYWRAVMWFAALAVWSQCLVIAGILVTARTGKATYFEERTMISQHVSMSPVTHALSHGVAIIPLLVIGSALGALIYWIAKRGRTSTATMAT